jgi:putative tryptophan/tyrosine transport system substrate-binding protein
MHRRRFIALLGGAIALPCVAAAQHKAMPVIGYLNPTSPGVAAPATAAFRQGLSEAGYVEGRNVAIEYRWADGKYDRLPSLAGELVSRQVAVIVTGGATPTALAAKAATGTIPIVFVLGSDPVQFDLVKSLARPGGNVTGVTVLDVELIPKAFELLHELVPTAATIAVLVNPNNLLVETQTGGSQIAAHNLGVHLLVLNASSQSEIDTAFTTLVEQRAGALLVTGEPLFFGTARDQLIALAARHAVPTIYQFRQLAEAGGLMSYGTSLADAQRISGVYAGRILRGERPADLPVQQSTKVELVINLKTTHALGLTAPPSVLARADEVME